MFIDNKLLRDGLYELGERLPSKWRADLATGPNSNDITAYIRVTAPDRKTGLLAVETRRRLEPREVIEFATKLRTMSVEGIPFVIAPYLSPAVREQLQEAAIAFLDLTGNIRLEIPKPGLFIERQGADINPNRKERPTRSLRGPKAGRLVRMLVDSVKLYGVRELAKLADVDPGYASRLLSLLATEALVERVGRGRIVKVDWPKLLKRWAEDSPLESRGIQGSYLAHQGLKSLQSRLKGLKKMRYAITGALAASRVAPIAPPRLAMIYVEDIKRAISDLELREVEAGANVLLIEPSASGVFSGVVKDDDLSFVALSQAAADLLTSPGRGPAEAEELITWMKNHEEAWRG